MILSKILHFARPSLLLKITQKKIKLLFPTLAESIKTKKQTNSIWPITNFLTLPLRWAVLLIFLNPHLAILSHPNKKFPIPKQAVTDGLGRTPNSWLILKIHKWKPQVTLPQTLTLVNQEVLTTTQLSWSAA